MNEPARDTALPDPGEPPVSHLLYLHGFRSGPQSTKARQMGAWVAQHRPQLVWACPQLPASPADALALIQGLVADWPAAGLAVVGSSLGGYYATVLAEALGCRAVVINPAVDPARDLARHVGASTTWHGAQPFQFDAAHVDELRAMAAGTLRRPARYLALIAKGDEVLDWREMAARYAGAQLTLLEGGDHALSDFEHHLPAIARFFGWGLTARLTTPRPGAPAAAPPRSPAPPPPST
jgi:predicted esterase YcpF (UPF0227 family)